MKYYVLKNKENSGFSLILIIIAVVAIAGLSVGMSQISSISTLNQLEFNQANDARNLAYSGVEYIKGLIYYEKSLNKSPADFLTDLTAGAKEYSLGTDKGSFVISIPSSSTTGNTVSFTVSSIGKSPAGAFHAEYQIPSSVALSYTYTPSTPPVNPKVPTAITAASIGMSGNFYGDYVISDSYVFNGGANVYGSIDYTGTGKNSYGDYCLHIVGTSVGQTVGADGIKSHICSNTCVIIDGGITINANIYSRGDVTIENGTVNGEIHSGGKVTLTWSGHVNNDIYVSGSQNSGSVVVPQYSNLVNGTIYYNQPIPDSCSSYTLPTHETVASSTAINLVDKGGTTGQLTFFGKSDINDHSYAYTSIKTGGGTKICFDLSVPNTYINIFNSGTMEINGNVYVRTSTATNCFDSANQLTSISSFDSLIDVNGQKVAKYTYASKVYVDVLGTVAFNGGSNWFGTIYSKGNITPGGGTSFIGALYTNGSLNIKTNGNKISTSADGLNLKFVASDYATKYWK